MKIRTSTLKSTSPGPGQGPVTAATTSREETRDLNMEATEVTTIVEDLLGTMTGETDTIEVVTATSARTATTVDRAMFVKMTDTI